MKIYKYILLLLILSFFSCKHGFVKSTSISKEYCNISVPKTDNFEVYYPTKRVVKIDNFFMCDHEVTQGEWQWLMNNVDSFIKYDIHGKGEKYPMYNVSWFDTIKFCNKLSEKHGLSKCYTINGNSISYDFNKNGYRLPTMAEWEYASCAGFSGRLFYSGATKSTDKDIDSYVWHGNNSGRKLHYVATKATNKFGLYDMSGNVWEWCWDWYEDGYSETDNPKGPKVGSKKVFRGGGYQCDLTNVNPRSVIKESPSHKWKILGFRVCRSTN